jgi:hypothetical protein
MFKFANNLNTPEEITNSSRARSHGEKIFEAVALVVDYINDEDYCQTLLRQLGNLKFLNMKNSRIADQYQSKFLF